ncbi:hypothetical protein [Actimicrobium sp. CCI2.3]|uniref:hypothetical protein n=1 Tax=Actimicrobium sp. CCI2.3 TaxID=3048616 RepID=UPI002AB35A2F|nr:hypothetical protein [Actimicrobium sp. CCI2.3]MDY7575043.1 hypothetical protein [Actimicrobium sp. CCI2.3]MEB0021387.1 hypothetical protein [Actimicrobium sp. CCI2.3]
MASIELTPRMHASLCSRACFVAMASSIDREGATALGGNLAEVRTGDGAQGGVTGFFWFDMEVSGGCDAQ